MSSSNKCLNPSDIFGIIESVRLRKNLQILMRDNYQTDESSESDFHDEDDGVLLAVSGDDEGFCVVNTNFY
jgi:hypothetical protein